MGKRMMSAILNVFSLGSPRGSQGQAGAPPRSGGWTKLDLWTERGPCGGIDLEALGVYGH